MVPNPMFKNRNKGLQVLGTVDRSNREEHRFELGEYREVIGPISKLGFRIQIPLRPPESTEHVNMLELLTSYNLVQTGSTASSIGSNYDFTLK